MGERSDVKLSLYGPSFFASMRTSVHPFLLRLLLAVRVLQHPASAARVPVAAPPHAT